VGALRVFASIQMPDRPPRVGVNDEQQEENPAEDGGGVGSNCHNLVGEHPVQICRS
jgi:hypothetical protein